MKQIAVVLFIGFALSLCNLSERLHKGGSGSGSNSAGGVTDNAAKPERAQPSAAQTAALSGGSEAKWDRQGMSFTVPPNWTEAQQDSKNLTWRSPGEGAASLIVSISPMAGEFPVDASIQAFFDGAKTIETSFSKRWTEQIKETGYTATTFANSNRVSQIRVSSGRANGETRIAEHQWASFSE